MGLRNTKLAAMLAALFVLVVPCRAGSMGLRWDPVVGAAGYNVYYGNSPGVYTHHRTVGNKTRVTLTGLDDCTQWFVAVKSYNTGGESTGFSGELAGWPRPEIQSHTPTVVMQGRQYTLDLHGANFKPGAELRFAAPGFPTDMYGTPLIRPVSVSVLSCNHLQALITVEAAARGFRAMRAGNFNLAFEVRNPDAVYGSEPVMLDVRFNQDRWDINRSEPATVDRVDGGDLTWLAFAYASREGEPRYAPDADLDGDGQIDGTDLAYLASGFGRCRTAAGWAEEACP